MASSEPKEEKMKKKRIKIPECEYEADQQQENNYYKYMVFKVNKLIWIFHEPKTKTNILHNIFVLVRVPDTCARATAILIALKFYYT